MARLYLGGQGGGAVRGGRPAAGLLHRKLRLATQLLPAAALHLCGGGIRVFGPQTVAVAEKFLPQAGKFLRGITAQRPVDGPRAQQPALAGQLAVSLAAQPAHRPGQCRHAQAVQRVLHRNVAGKAPQSRVPAAPQPQMPEHAMEHAVQVGAGQIGMVFAVQPQQPAGRKAEPGAVGGKSGQGVLLGGRQRAEGGVHIGQRQVQFAPDGGKYFLGHGAFPFGLCFNVLAGHGVPPPFREI